MERSRCLSDYLADGNIMNSAIIGNLPLPWRKSNVKILILSAYAEDHGLWPWMNGKRITLRSLVRRRVCFGGFRRRTWKDHGLCPWGSIYLLQREMAGDLMGAADVLQLRLGGGVGTEGWFSLGFVHRTTRDKAAAGSWPLEIEHAPPTCLDTFGLLCGFLALFLEQ